MSTPIENVTEKLRNGIAKAIHDGPTAQRQYREAGIAPHPWESCPYQDQYLGDADAVLTYLTGGAS